MRALSRAWEASISIRLEELTASRSGSHGGQVQRRTFLDSQFLEQFAHGHTVVISEPCARYFGIQAVDRARSRQAEVSASR